MNIYTCISVVLLCSSIHAINEPKPSPETQEAREHSEESGLALSHARSRDTYPAEAPEPDTYMVAANEERNSVVKDQVLFVEGDEMVEYENGIADTIFTTKKFFDEMRTNKKVDMPFGIRVGNEFVPVPAEKVTACESWTQCQAWLDLDIVVSGDSDVFCYRNVKTMVRPTRHRGQYVFNVLDKSLALRKMRLNADDLVVLAVVSGNDYESNIPGKAIVTNVKIFQKMKEKGDFSKEAMLKEYLRLCQSDRNFDVAKGVFFNCDEGKVLDPLDRSKELEIRRRVLSRISEDRAAFVANRGNRGTAPMKCPVPPVLKVSPKVVEFDSDKYEDVKEVPKVKAVKPSSKAKAKRAPSGRSSRRQIVERDDSDEETSTKNFTDATRAIASLSQRAIAERATEMLIDSICSSNQDTHLLLQLTHGGKGGATYWQNLLRIIIDGQIGRVGSEHLPILEKVEALWDDEFLENLPRPDTSIKILMLTVLMKKVAADIDTVFSNQIVGMLPLLKERVVEVVGEEGKQAIEEIEAWVDESLENDPPSPPPPVQVFYRINRLLPSPYRWSVVPHTSFGDGYVTMSEECLFDLLLDIPSFQNPSRGYLEHDERPVYLKPPSKDKDTPMKRKADEGGSSRGGPNKSRKTR
ncbi:hypothetical protein SeLEV6574_g00958 [Synchytrium endobioticum]|uniref:XPG-I domain-containing protein n=1 Tax=Synchytrium endobioticum TaxID=286115 RepID=A0A507DF55_9FUNG|nr:hypothetical protein SeLEV6574_g00958 [Synchytrium endobioticum]